MPTLTWAWHPIGRLFIGFSFLLGGCGYHQSGSADLASDPNYAWSGLYREDVKTVAVPIFVNRTFYRGVEFSLSKAVVNQIENRTPYKVVPKERADTILEGEVINVRLRTISRSAFNALPQEQIYVIVVNFTWKDMRTGKIYTQRHNYEQTAPYYPTLGEGQFAGEQENVERLAVAIVEEMEAEWGGTQPAK
jgi:hypothetical protein